MATTRQQAEKPTDDTIKETFESIVIAFILAFVFRAYVVEAFVIPTGSMAPTLLGRHARVDCSQCGYRFTVDPGQEEKGVVFRGDYEAACPMCHYPNALPHGARISSGDRILVHKYIYSLTDPKRWDVIVFKNPQENNPDGSPGPTTNYIKRLIGLPNERLSIIEGNIYVQKTGGEADRPWQIARKTDRPRVQRAVWQPISHTRYAPLDKGTQSPGRSQFPWRYPWSSSGGQRRDWKPFGRGGQRYESDKNGVLKFDFQLAVQGGPGLHRYNQLSRSLMPYEPVEDVRVAGAFDPDRPGLSVTLSTMARVDDPDGRALKLVGRVADGEASLLVLDPRTDGVIQRCGTIQVDDVLTPGRASEIELWYVDQEASLWIDGRRVLVRQFDLPIEIIKERKQPLIYPDIAVEVEGSPVTIHRLEVDRDLYYSNVNSRGVSARGSWSKTNWWVSSRTG